jgi:hypothetical protein
VNRHLSPTQPMPPNGCCPGSKLRRVGPPTACVNRRSNQTSASSSTPCVPDSSYAGVKRR